jgi:hypothetical protein
MRPALRVLRSPFVQASVWSALATLAAAQISDPFAPQTRWIAAPAPGASWMPASVDFGAGGELVFAAGALSSPRWMVFSSPQSAGGQVQPLRSVQASSGTLSNMSVKCADGANELFALAQIPDPDSSHRRTEVSRFDALAANGFTPAWTHDLGWRVNGGAKLCAAADGSRVVALVDDVQTQQLRLEWLDGASGSLLRRIDWSGGTLRQFAASADVGSVAIVAGLELWVFDSNAVQLHHENLLASTQALALAGDGSALCIGAPGLLRVLGWNSSAFLERFREIAPANELPVRCALSDDGRTWAAGWWNASSGRDVRLELRGGPSDGLIWQQLQTAPSPAPQNYPEAVCIARDGRRAAFGVWGSQDAQPEVVLVDRDQGAVVAQLDLPGSVVALALDPSATRLAIGMKHGHANQFATSGEVRLFDTGERDLQSLGQSPPGQPLAVSARHGAAQSVWFLYGPRSSWPRPIQGVSGMLSLARPSLTAIRVQADASGRGDANLPIPSIPSASGVPFSVQALFRSRSSSAFSASVLDPLCF